MRKIRTTIPFGWTAAKAEGYMEAVPLEQEMLEKARDYLQNCSLREVASWLSRSTGRTISHMGLKYIREHDWKVLEDGVWDEEETEAKEIRTTMNVTNTGFPPEEEVEEYTPASPIQMTHSTYRVEELDGLEE